MPSVAVTGRVFTVPKTIVAGSAPPLSLKMPTANV